MSNLKQFNSLSQVLLSFAAGFLLQEIPRSIWNKSHNQGRCHWMIISAWEQWSWFMILSHWYWYSLSCIHSFQKRLMNSFNIHPFVDIIHAFIPSFIHSFMSMIHGSILRFMHSFIHSFLCCSCFLSSIYSSIHLSFMLSFIHLLIHVYDSWGCSLIHA